ncbi:hypothetical protein S7711_06566 [Stachybotrys chartarum IBT 7711]|uniref:Type 1 phosphatases regulator n=1 Tax=Stachybotrys chartarum (strain CBS 109288 / IBT 7711) TaxID=1280523 RepID=A0A084AYL9_STACB|nr:hypothetical protein S7711_06566 [Stachybotrys chartarum IBT 7711]KFA50295.1 hypothetical protein S40293_03349 [Stachybotrys chartarum IBT 40293]KFA78341.1 hypothetical protein S40288_05003 [Stachybotrys chartarum IBT 40288]
MSQRPQRRAPAPAASLTQTVSHSGEASGSGSNTRSPRVLRLRGQHTQHSQETSNGRAVQWADDVVDNEGMGRKSSKGQFNAPRLNLGHRLVQSTKPNICPVCCIYHRPKAVGESSDESSSDSSDSDSDGGSGPDHGHKGDHGKDHDCGHRHGRPAKKDSKQKRPPSPNAYEKIPKPKPRGDAGQAQT